MLGSARETALSIWHSGVDAVKADHLIGSQIELNASRLSICNVDYSLKEVGGICVVGAGKAAGYLATALELKLQPIAEKTNIHGWVNVPDNCLLDTRFIHLHAGRPAGINEPREEGVLGTQQILKTVSSLDPSDLCICLLTGGGSALLPAPRAGITLEDKLNVTRLMSANGASIQDLNRVRTAMSDIKGGGLSRACAAKQLITLIVSDVIGDPLDVIASGPTVISTTTGDAPIDILRQCAEETDLPQHLWEFFESDQPESDRTQTMEGQCAQHYILANNAAAVSAAADRAKDFGLEVQIIPPEPSNKNVEEVAQELIARLGKVGPFTPTCLIWGGEPVVKLAPASERGIGGRNQQLVLEALRHWDGLPKSIRTRLCILSAGTDGEDGPTDAAGAFCDQSIAARANSENLDIRDYLKRNDAYTFFDQVDGLIRTGPTHTNVCDLRVAVVQ